MPHSLNHPWRYYWDEEGKVGSTNLWVWTFHNETWREHKSNTNTIYSYIKSYEDSGETFPNEELVVKILRFLNRNWKPKVTLICELKNYETMDTHTLFEKLQVHEKELKRLTMDDQESKKIKSLALKIGRAFS